MQPYERIKYLRKEILNKSQEEFSSTINLSRSNLGNIETGKVSLTERVTDDICRKFNVNPEWLIYGVEPVFNELTEDEELAIALAELSNEHDDFVVQFIRRYWKLDESERKIIRSFLGSLPSK